MTTAARVCAQSLQSCLVATLWNVASQLQARTLEWFAMPSFRVSSWPRDWIRVSCGSWIAGGFFTAEASGKPPVTIQFSSFQSLSCIRLFATPWTAARQASLSITNSRSLLKLMSIQLVMSSMSSSVVPFSSHLQSFPASRSFPMSQFFASGGQSTRDSASASVLPMNIQDWFPLGWTGWISLQSKGLSRVFSNTTVQKQQFFGAQPSL